MVAYLVSPVLNKDEEADVEVIWVQTNSALATIMKGEALGMIDLRPGQVLTVLEGEHAYHVAVIQPNTKATNIMAHNAVRFGKADGEDALREPDQDKMPLRYNIVHSRSKDYRVNGGRP